MKKAKDNASPAPCLPGLVPAARVAGGRPYSSTQTDRPIDLWLNGNEGVVPPSELLQALAAKGPEILRRYPKAAALEHLIAGRHGLDPTRVLVTSGVDDALYRACLAMLEPGREVILPTPTFEMLPRYTQLAGAKTIDVPWPQGDYPTDRVLECVSPQTAMIVVVSPNNPTGAVASAADIRRLSAAAPHALLVLDFAYGEFADEDLTPVGLSLPNALVMRTLSKAWGLAGLRVGYVLGPAELVNWLRITGNPYAVAAPSLAMAAAWLEEGGSTVDAFVRCVREERENLIALLRRLGGRPLPSQGNFVLVQLANALRVFEELARRGIAVRAFPDHPELHDRLRITCPGSPAAFTRLTGALQEVLGGDSK